MPPQLLLPQRLRINYLRLQRRRRQEEQIIAALAVPDLQPEERRRRTVWVKLWLLRRHTLGHYDTLMQELMREAKGDFKAFLRIEPAMFRELLDRLTPRISKHQDCRPGLEAGLRLAITLRFLATGNSYHSLAFSFKVAPNTISNLVPEVCRAIVVEYVAEVLHTPSTPEEWREVANGFSSRWNYHHCIGAIDGKHVAIKKPRKSGTVYYNYKGFYSIVLLGIVDGDYKFLWVNVGAPGSVSDAGVFNNSTFEPDLREGRLMLPPPDHLPNDNQDTPYFLVGDDAFALRMTMMKPYSHRFLSHDERIFNYRTSRARRVVENTFGIMAMRFRCLLTPLAVQPENAIVITKACVILHQIMRLRYPGLQNADMDQEAANGQIIRGAWRDAAMMAEMREVQRAPRETRDGKLLRTALKHYYNSEAGSVPWQEAALNYNH